MKLILLIVLTALAALTAGGCGSSKLLATSEQDSVRIEVNRRDIVVYDTVVVEIPLLQERQTIRQDSSFLSNQYASSEAVILPDGQLYHSLATTPQQLQQSVETAVEVRDSVIYRERIVRERIEVERELSRWQLLQLNGFWTLLLLFAIMVTVLRLRL